MLLLLLLLSVLVRSPASGDHSDVFSSTADLARLLRLEASFVTDLASLADTLAGEAAAIRRYLDTQYPAGAAARTEVEAEQFVSHPVNSLYLVKRLGVELQRAGLPGLLASDTAARLRAALNTSLGLLPTAEDWEGAASGVALLQEHYHLDITQLSAGTVQYGGVQVGGDTFAFQSSYIPTLQVSSSHELEGEELYQIGVSAVNRGYFDTGLEWLQLAGARLRAQGRAPFLPGGLRELEGHIADAEKLHDHYLDRSGAVGPRHRCNRLPFDAKLRRKKKYRAAKRDGSRGRAARLKQLVPLYQEFRPDSSPRELRPIKEASLRDNFEDVCVGETHRSRDMDIGQECRHLHHQDPASRLGPFQYEQLSSQPLISIIHQLMTDQEMEHFKVREHIYIYATQNPIYLILLMLNCKVHD